MPKLKKTTYRYELEGVDETTALTSELFEVTPILADLLRAELEGPKHGILDPKRQAIHLTVLWLWSAGLRNGQHELDFRTFRDRCLNFEVVAETDGTEVQGVPPTLAVSPTASPSSSPPATDTPPPLAHGVGYLPATSPPPIY